MESTPILRCTWCCKDTPTSPCHRCGNDVCLTDRTKPHRPEWSRKTISTVECKVCDRSGPYSIQTTSDDCPGNHAPIKVD